LRATTSAAKNDIRVATYPTVTGEKSSCGFSILPRPYRSANCPCPPPPIPNWKQFLRQSTGLLLLTGPAGSGKTTTIYACLRHLVEPGGRQIITVEDPVEQIVPGTMQTEVNEAIGLDFARAARHLPAAGPAGAHHWRDSR